LLPAMDLSLLQFLEREKVLEVLRRDKQLRIIEEDRIRRMKYELQELRRRGAKSFTRQYGERTCARCQRPLGKFWNSGSICRGCSHRICTKCRVGATDWKCTVCHFHLHVCTNCKPNTKFHFKQSSNKKISSTVELLMVHYVSPLRRGNKSKQPGGGAKTPKRPECSSL
uniref:RabBD domain-containing protein n=1 Tax=Salarias fasciatus TaxID=181472 RepID=A0A672HH66_SALFA